MTKKISERGLNIIKEYEALRLVAYLCPANVWTIGYGHTRGVTPGMKITAAKADELLLQDVAEFERDVNQLVGAAATTQGQFDAMVSFAFNVGSDIDLDKLAEGLGDSTLLRKHLAGDFKGAAREFAKWNKAKGKVLKGLTRRRAAEAALYAS